ncbi:MAG TPA: calcium/sodium antiporter [Bacteroidales bacterium]|nr:calcium/sodium antiporter [Bacteroidales bacterium]
MLTILLFIVGFVILIKGADLLITGSVSLARRMKISSMIIGLTIVSMGTSMPELVVNIFASAQGQSEIAIGNIFGSNISNVLLILGLSAIVRPLLLQHNTLIAEIPFALLATMLVGFFANTMFFDDPGILYIGRVEGGILLFFFLLFMAYIVYSTQNSYSTKDKQDIAPSLPKWKEWLYIGLAIIMLFIGGKWVVDGAVVLASMLGMSEGFVALTIVAVGTSLPELVTSMLAAAKKETDIAVGNIIGSNIFNLFWILGISATIKPLPLALENNYDILVMIASVVMIVLAMLLNRSHSLSRFSGVVFVLFYVAYVVYLVQRG